MKTRAEMDQAAWAIIEASAPSNAEPLGYEASGRPANFVELGQMVQETEDWERCWSEFRHEFFRYKTEGFFSLPAPSTFSIERRAFLAAAAEALCRRFDLPVPSWTQEAVYTLQEPWDPVGFWYPDVPFTSRVAASSPVFLKHNVVFAERGLIAL